MKSVCYSSDNQYFSKNTEGIIHHSSFIIHHSKTMNLTPSHIIEYLYCPRFTFYEYVMTIPQNEDQNYKVMRGRELHDRKLEENKDYLRRRIGAVGKHLDQYLTNDLLRGRVDEVLELADGTLAPLDYKFAEWNE